MPLPRRPQPRRRPTPKPAAPKPAEPKESDNDKVCGRALTIGPDRPPYLDSGLTFRQFNEKYEEWLARRYTDDITPYTRHPSSAYDPFLTEYSKAMRIELDAMTSAISRRLSAQAARSPFMLFSVNHSWQRYTKEKREEIVLKVMEDACVRAEKGEYCWSREDTPELTLEWATGFDERGFANWIRMWENQGQTEEEKKKSKEDPDALPYHNLRNKKWDRVNGFLEVEASSTPVKKSIRAFLHDGLGRRNYHLRQFIEAVFAEMGGPQVKFVESAPSSVPRPTEDEIKLMREGGGGIVESAQQSIDIVACNHCFTPPEFKPIPFACSKCKSVNKVVKYCSADCQRQAWPTHKKVCGVPLANVGSVASFSDTPSSKR